MRLSTIEAMHRPRTTHPDTLADSEQENGSGRCEEGELLGSVEKRGSVLASIGLILQWGVDGESIDGSLDMFGVFLVHRRRMGLMSVRVE